MMRTIIIFLNTHTHHHDQKQGSLQEAGRSSDVERSLLVRWVVGSILHGVDPLSYFSFHPVLHDWCNETVVCVILSVGWCI